MEANVARAERSLALLTTTFLANTESVKANIALVLDTILSQNLFTYMGAAEVSADTAKRYSSAIHKWLARINSLATGKTSESRMAGVLLIKHTAQQSPQLFAENVGKWTTVLVGVLGKAEITPVVEAVLQTLLAFVDAVRDIPMLHREIVSAQVPRINQAILALADKNPDLTGPVLQMLEHMATWFPKLFRPSIDKTAALCLRLLDGSASRASAGLCAQAAQCLAALSLAGGRVASEERWFEYVQQAVGTIQQCIDRIMCAETGDSVQSAFALPELADNFVVAIPQAADRISAMADVLVALLTQPTAEDVGVPVDAILGAASRLALVPVRAASSKMARAELDVVPVLAPQIQRASVRIMAALAISLGSLMHPYLSAVARAATAIGTQQISSAATRVALHNLLQLYIERYAYGFVVHLPYDLIITAVGEICVYQRSQAPPPTLEIVSSKKRSGSGKARGGSALSDETAPVAHLRWDDTTLAAQATVLALLLHTPTMLTSALRTQIDSQVLTLLMLYAIGGIETPFATRESDVPYKVQLLRCLEASLLSPDPWQRAIVPHAVAVFNASQNDPSPRVRAASAAALVAIDPIIHSRLPAQLREPDTEENISEEKQVARMVAASDDSVSIEAVLAGTQLDSPSDDDNEEMQDADGSTDHAKRFRREELETNVSMPAANTRPLTGHLPATNLLSTPVDPQPSLSQPSQPAAAAEPAASPPAPRFDPAKQLAKPKPLAKPKAAPSNDDDDDDDDIPDIVMEGSDSEDE